METEIFKLLASGSVSLACLGVLIWIVIKEMPAQRAEFRAELALERQQFIAEIRSMRVDDHVDREADRKARHDMANAVNSLAHTFAASGLNASFGPAK